MTLWPRFLTTCGRRSLQSAATRVWYVGRSPWATSTCVRGADQYRYRGECLASVLDELIDLARLRAGHASRAADATVLVALIQGVITRSTIASVTIHSAY